MLKGKKTYVTGILAILGAWGAYATGDASINDAINLTIPALMGMFIRNGVANQGQK